MNPSIALPILRGLEDAINRQILGSALAREKCAALSGKTVGLQFIDWGIEVQIGFLQDGIVLIPTIRAADVQLSGRWQDFLGFLFKSESRDAQKSENSQLCIHGNVQTAQDAQQLFKKLDWSAEEAFAEVFGEDVAAFAVPAFRYARKNIRRVKNNLWRSLSEYGDENELNGKVNPLKQFDDWRWLISRMAFMRVRRENPQNSNN